jgi:hypothetical protein
MQGTLGSVEHMVVSIPSKITGAAETLQHMVQPSPLLTELVVGAGNIETKLEQEFEKKLSPKLQAGLAQLVQLITLLQLIHKEYDYVERRFKYALNSFASLNQILKKGSSTPRLLENIQHLLMPRDGKDAGMALLGLAEYALVHANPVMGMAMSIVHGGGGGMWSDLFPYGLAPGDLDAWINEDKVDPEEREFRKEMVAALDHYFRGKYGSKDHKGLLRAADQREAIQTLIDLTSVLFSTLFGYALRHPKLPSMSLPKLDWAHPFPGVVRHDDSAAEFAITFSRHLGYQVKAVTGLYLRGFWEVNTHNDALVESVSAIASNLFNTLIEAFLHNLLWSIEIHETYEETSKNSVWNWDTKEAVDGGGTLSYQVFVRPGFLSEVEAKILKSILARKEADVLKKLLRDYGAYADALRPYREVELPVAAKDKVVIDKVAAVKPETVKVSARSTHPANFLSVPVLRAYCNGTALVMKATGTAGSKPQLYECTFASNGTNLKEGDTIHVRSNYGGAASQVYS